MGDQHVQRLESLTKREREVFEQLGEGASQEKLSQALGFTPKTAAAYTNRLMKKFSVASRSALARLAASCRPERTPRPSSELSQTVASAVDPAVWVSVFDAHPDPLMYIACDYKVLRVNLALAKLLGRRAASCQGSHCYQLLHGCDTPPADCPCVTVIKEKRSVTCDLRLTAVGKPFRLTISPIRDQNGAVSGILHAARSMTLDGKLELPACTSSGSSLTERQTDLRPEKANRYLFDRLLAFVLHHVGQHAADPRNRSVLLNNFIEMLSEFGLGHISLWQVSDEGPRAVFRHTFAEAKYPSAPACPSPGSPLFKEAKRNGFAKASADGSVKCLATLSGAVAGSATYVMLVKCAEGSSGCAFLQAEPMRFMCDVLGEIVRQATADEDALAGRGLTPREIAVLRLLEGNYLHKTIAGQLGVSLHTVHVHIRNIYRKLRVHSRAEAVRKWRTHSWNCCRTHSSVQT
jgi:DNA-binding CsgD family transcriptional regulator